jgi:hypothetical protein
MRVVDAKGLPLFEEVVYEDDYWGPGVAVKTAPFEWDRDNTEGGADK